MRKRATSPPGVVMPAPDAPKTQEAVRLIREEARRLLPECSGILGDVTAYTDASALWMLTRMHFSFLDSLVRLVGVPRGASEDWPAFVREARWFADPRNGADVRRVFAAIWLSGADLPAFRALLIHFLCCGLVAAEIRRRLEQRHYSEAWQEYISTPTASRIPTLLRELTKTAKISITTRSGARKAVPLFTQIQGVDDDTAVALAALAKLDAKQRENLRPLALDAPPTVGAQLPGHTVPSWDAALPGLFAKAVAEIQAAWLPVLEGTMEKGPFAVHAAYSAAKEHDVADLRSGVEYSFESLFDAPDDAPVRVKPKRTPRAPNPTTDPDPSEYVLPNVPRERWPVRPISAKKTLNARLKEDPLRNTGDPRQTLAAVGAYLATLPPHEREAIRLYRLEGMTQERAAKEAGTSVETLKKALDKLAMRFPPKDR